MLSCNLLSINWASCRKISCCSAGALVAGRRCTRPPNMLTSKEWWVQRQRNSLRTTFTIVVIARFWMPHSMTSYNWHCRACQAVCRASFGSQSGTTWIWTTPIWSTTIRDLYLWYVALKTKLYQSNGHVKSIYVIFMALENNDLTIFSFIGTWIYRRTVETIWLFTFWKHAFRIFSSRYRLATSTLCYRNPSINVSEIAPLRLWSRLTLLMVFNCSEKYKRRRSAVLSAATIIRFGKFKAISGGYWGRLQWPWTQRDGRIFGAQAFCRLHVVPLHTTADRTFPNSMGFAQHRKWFHFHLIGHTLIYRSRDGFF